MRGPARVASGRHTGLLLIASFKLFKGVLLLLGAIGLLTLLNKDLESVVLHWTALLHVDPDNRFIHRFIIKLGSVDNRTLEHISAGTFVYASLFLTEGVGLFLQRRWAEYLTVIATASFIPIELYELALLFSAPRLVLLMGNLAIVWYLAVLLRKDRTKA